MTTPNKMSPNERGALGQYLWDLRQAAKLSLRQVEEECDGVSNAYLSQIETGKNSKPSPHVLSELAELYGGSFDKMMTLAGHISAKKSTKEKRSTRLPTFAEDLTPDEEDELLKYLAFIRTRKGKS